MTVERVRVGDVLRLARRPVTVDPLREYEEIGVRSFGKGIFHKVPVGGAALGSKRVFEIHPGELVLSNVFAWEGAVAVSSEAERGKIGSHRFMTYEAIDERIDINWAAWFFKSEAGLELLGKASPGSAGRNRTLAVDRFEAIQIPLPATLKQRNVATVLNDWWLRSQHLEAEIASNGPDVLAMRLPILVEAIIRRSAIHERVVEDLVELVGDVVHPGDDPGPAATFVGLQHIEGHTGRRLGGQPLGAETGRKFRFRPGDVVYGYLRPYLNKAWVADCHGLCSVDQYVLRPKEGVDPQLVAYLLRSAGVLDQAVELTHSLQLPRLRSGLLKQARINIPRSEDTAELVDRLNSTTERVLAAAELKRRQMRAAASLHPALMNEYFGSGSRS